jgi:excinuclease ABC subunit C
VSDQFDAKAFLKTVTSQPGVYRMYDAGGTVIYVGKAKDLKKRLSSYFRSNLASRKTEALVAQIQQIDVTVTHTETEALLLEHNYIKLYQPRYNVLLRDDKSYPFIFLSGDTHPRLAMHRGAKHAKGEYFGPFPNGYAVRETLALLQKIFPIRQCENSVYRNRSRPCLQYQIGRCLGPCVEGLVSEEEYAQQVEYVLHGAITAGGVPACPGRYRPGHAGKTLSGTLRSVADGLQYDVLNVCSDCGIHQRCR